MSRLADVPPMLAGHCCDFCSCRNWSAQWRGHRFVHICRECALKWLPALFADATHKMGFSQLDGDRDLERFHATYWRAQLINTRRGK